MKTTTAALGVFALAANSALAAPISAGGSSLTSRSQENNPPFWGAHCGPVNGELLCKRSAEQDTNAMCMISPGGPTCTTYLLPDGGVDVKRSPVDTPSQLCFDFEGHLQCLNETTSPTHVTPPGACISPVGVATRGGDTVLRCGTNVAARSSTSKPSECILPVRDTDQETTCGADIAERSSTDNDRPCYDLDGAPVCPDKNSTTHLCYMFEGHRRCVGGKSMSANKRENIAEHNAAGVVERENIATHNAAGVVERENIATHNAAGVVERENIATHNAAGVVERGNIADQNAAGAVERSDLLFCDAEPGCGPITFNMTHPSFCHTQNGQRYCVGLPVHKKRYEPIIEALPRSESSIIQRPHPCTDIEKQGDPSSCLGYYAEDATPTPSLTKKDDPMASALGAIVTPTPGQSIPWVYLPFVEGNSRKRDVTASTDGFRGPCVKVPGTDYRLCKKDAHFGMAGGCTDTGDGHWLCEKSGEGAWFPASFAPWRSDTFAKIKRVAKDCWWMGRCPRS